MRPRGARSPRTRRSIDRALMNYRACALRPWAGLVVGLLAQDPRVTVDVGVQSAATHGARHEPVTAAHHGPMH